MSDRKEYKKKWYQDNKSRLLEKQNEYYLSNVDERKEYQKKYSSENKEKVSDTRHNYYLRNKKKINDNFNKYDLNRRKIDPSYKLRKNCSSMIWQALNGKKNNQSILKYLPYTMVELKFHLENKFDKNMSWANYGIYWHIDHIYPQSLLPYTSMSDDNFKICWALDNLRPLEKTENLKKSNKLIGDL